MADRMVHLTDEGYEKVRYWTISTTDADIQYQGEYIVVTSSATGRTYILNPEDIDYIDQGGSIKRDMKPEFELIPTSYKKGLPEKPKGIPPSCISNLPHAIITSNFGFHTSKEKPPAGGDTPKCKITLSEGMPCILGVLFLFGWVYNQHRDLLLTE